MSQLSLLHHNAGRKQSAEHVEKRVAPRRGRPCPATAGDKNPMRRPEHRGRFMGDANPMRRPEVAAKLRGENHGRWVGDDVGYQGMHDRARSALAGHPCALVDETCKGPLHSALIRGRGTKQEWRGGSFRWYSTRVEDYVRLCDSHHVRYDQYGTVTLEAA